MRRLPLALALLALPAFAASVWFAFLRPIEPIMPSYLALAEALSRGEATRGFEPLGYPALIAGWLGGVERTLRIVHALCLWGTWVLIAWLALRMAALDRDGQRRGRPWWLWAWVGFWLAAIFLNPYFLIGLPRVSDSAVDILLIGVLFTCALAAREARLRDWLLAGVALGLFVLVRPNSITLLAALAIVAWRARTPWSRPLALAVASLAAFVALSWSLTGTPFFWPKNGGYNLFAGNNPFAHAELVGNHNAEYSLDKALQWCGVEGDRYAVPGDVYVDCTTRFIGENPGEFLRLTAYKAYTMLWRPNLKLADTPIKVAVQYAILLPGLMWWALFVVSRRFRASLPGVAGFLFVLLYALPFALTNADPRFRIPLDVVYAMSALAFALGDRQPIRHSSRSRP
ncbi:MAG: hypothetical protein KF889_11890 [Alphaproteobacteria bacterium]|nr:hypothetical protein [Alphaproteobacteria bacterium]MCW5739310.1 hypothetical protein [Alphaproteobacteria bacterium]